MPVEQMLASYNKIRNTIVFSLIMFMFVGIIITYFISLMLTKNILRLNNVMKTVGKDNMDISIAIKSNDEISQLYLQFNAMVIRIKELVNDVKNTEAAKRKAELKALQAQINPHFLYNTLNTIKFLSTIYSAENIKEVSESLSRLMHISMDNRQFISVEEEIQYIESYLRIQEYKYTNKFVYNIIADDSVKGLMVLKLLLQPIVENAIIHGIAPMKGQGIVLIKMYKEGHVLKMKVQDNGLGISKQHIDDILGCKILEDSIGLSNVIYRIKLNFGADYGITILSEENLYTVIELIVPLIMENEVDSYA